MAIGGQQLTLVLCLVLRRVYSRFPENDQHMVDGAVNHSVTLPCSFTMPDNMKNSNAQVMWFRNFTDKLLDCAVGEGRTPVCWKSPDSSRTQISWKFFGNADLEISSLRESDAGPYQCWLILADAYRRQDTFLRLNGVHSNGSGKNMSPLHGFSQWNGLLTLSLWNIFLMTGWSIVLLLAGILLTGKLLTSYKKRRCTII